MPDREKVIMALKCSANGALHCYDCNCYYHEPGCACDRSQIMLDSLALLKEQEAVEPIKSPDKDDDYTFMCSNCKGELFCGDVLRDNFCPTCGRSVKWE